MTATATAPATRIEHQDLYIDGQWTPATSGQAIDVIDPTTEQCIGHVPEAPGEVGAAVAAARKAFETWTEVPVETRAELCAAIAVRLEARQDELATLIGRELGMPLTLSASIQVGLPIMTFASQPELVQQLEWEEQIGNSLIVREPVGVLGAITPWNYPLHQIAAKVAPAMTAGCTVVLKPSEITPLNAFVLAEIMDEVGVPPGVFNLITGSGPTVGEAIARHPEIDMVSFTGSTVAGRRVSELASTTVKRVALELGGKSANVILDDAPLDQAVADGVFKCFLNSGQTCSALHADARITRSALGRRVDGEGGRRIAADRRRPRPDGTARAAGERPTARACPGVHPDRDRRGCPPGVRWARHADALEVGYFVRPTVFSDVTPDMTIAREEIFGPVLAILPYDNEDDAVAKANDSAYGLAGGVWSASTERAESVARRIRAGQIEINGGTFNPMAPFGGYKQSGHGRELGRHGLQEFLTFKSMQR